MSRYLDLLERSAWTFTQTALAAWLVLDIDLWSVEALQVAGAAGAIAVAKSLLAFGVGSSHTAATLPAGPDTNLGGDHGHSDVVTIIAVAALILVLLLIFGAV
jgi:hypothetical protein